MTISRSFLRCAAALLLATLTIAIPATASADVGAADKLFREGKELMDQKAYAEACRKFEASFEADPALGTLLNLANCLQTDGRIASAYGRWGDAVELAQRQVPVDERVEYAREQREKLRPKLSFVTVQVKGKAPGLDIYRGNTKLSPGAYGTALPTDPGDTLVQVVRAEDDAVLWQQKIVLKEAESTSVAVDVETIQKNAPMSAKKRQALAEGGGRGTEAIPFWSAQRIAGLVVGSVGLAGAGVGFALGGVALSKTGSIDDNCTGNIEGTRYCTTAGQNAQQSATTFANASQWLVIGGAVVTGVGLTVFLTAPSGGGSELEERASTEPVRASVSPWASPDGAGLIVGGTF